MMFEGSATRKNAATWYQYERASIWLWRQNIPSEPMSVPPILDMPTMFDVEDASILCSYFAFLALETVIHHIKEDIVIANEHENFTSATMRWDATISPCTRLGRDPVDEGRINTITAGHQLDRLPTVLYPSHPPFQTPTLYTNSTIGTALFSSCRVVRSWTNGRRGPTSSAASRPENLLKTSHPERFGRQFSPAQRDRDTSSPQLPPLYRRWRGLVHAVVMPCCNVGMARLRRRPLGCGTCTPIHGLALVDSSWFWDADLVKFPFYVPSLQAPRNHPAP